MALLDPGASCESSSTGWGGGNLTQSGISCRRILTWADLSGGFGTSSSELLEFSAANKSALCPYFGGSLVLYCTDSALVTAADVAPAGNVFTANGCAVGTARNTCALNEAANLINFTRGFNVTGLRDRTFNVINTSGAAVTKVWKLGDIINSTPIVVGPPKERYDIIYGDATYASFFQRYKDRRQVAYVGANDGMLHAFNAGFFTADDAVISGSGSADTVQVRFSTTPKVKGSATACARLPCDAAVTQYDFRATGPALGAELWGYIPQDLLPQLRWMTSTLYDHVYYVDLKPKITDVRIFTADADHPGGWGTILIGGFRMGGSCSNCGSKGTARVVKADFARSTSMS
ncbi:MAG: PilC/PilY family type IV pilus protein, partial [candidate division NC10 bacterium]